MSKAAGAKKPSASQKAEALWAMKAAKDREEDFCDPARKENILGRKQARPELWEERPNHSLGQSSEVPRKSLSGLTSCSKFLRKVTRTAMACSWVGSGVLQKMRKASGPTWIRGTACACARCPLIGMFQGSMGRMASSFLLHKEEAGGGFK